MNKLFQRAILVGGLLLAGGSATIALAAERAYAVVDSVQMPVWIERGGQRVPLAPGKVLHNRDRIITGQEARVVIQLAEGSAVKLGEHAQLELNALGRRDKQVFTAALDVAKGAFRFTTGLFAKTLPHRAVNVRIATITAGIRGTDLWGRADAERDLVCLLEGRITVLHPQDEAREMSEPLSFYVAPKGGAPKPIDKVDPIQLVTWAAQTEIQPGGGHARRDGRWKVELATVDSETAALELYDRARAAGYATRIKPVAAEGGGYRYALRVTQLASNTEAEALAQRLARELELTAPVVTRF